MSSEEYESLTKKYEYLEYMLGLEDGSDDSYSLINGLDTIKKFYFHDAKPKRFKVIEDSAELDVQLYDVVSVRLKFKNIFDIQIRTDPICDYINEFYCYKNFDLPERIVFDIGFYKIVCEEITAEQI